MAGPMTGIRVLDLGAMIAGPMAATVLSDQGADVIKVESPGIGDVMRYLGAVRNGVSGLYHSTNRGKMSLMRHTRTSRSAPHQWMRALLMKHLTSSGELVQPPPNAGELLAD